MADNMNHDPSVTEMVLGACGVLIGLVARSKNWVDAKWNVLWRVVWADVASGGVIVAMALAIAVSLGLGGIWILFLGAGLMWLGLEPLRERVLAFLDKLIDAAADRVRGRPEDPPPPPGDPKA